MGPGRIAIGFLTFALTMGACGGSGTNPPDHTTTETTGGTGMQLTSTAFGHEATIPTKYTCDGEGVSPPLAIVDPPASTRTLVLIADDPDATRGTYDHWVAYDIPMTMAIAEGAEPLGTAGKNSAGSTGYVPPCPPRGTHRYVFTVYAMNGPLALGPAATKAEVLTAIEGRVLAEATLIGLYGR